MIKNVLSTIVLLLGMGFCQGQDNISKYIQYQIDSLDKIQPGNQKNVKPKGCAYIIKVRNQQEFDNINESISNAVNAGKKNIQVKIESGIYQFHKEHIRRKNEQTDVSISIIGDNAIITSDLNYKTTTGKGNGWQEMQYANGIIKVVDINKKLCMIPYENKFSIEERNNIEKVQITQWFRAKTYTIERIDTKGIYFIAPELAWDKNYGHKGYNVNFDYLYLGKIPRFRLYESSREPNCTASRFLTMENCKYRSLYIKGLVFRGNNSNNILLHFTNINTQQINIINCTFDWIRGNGVAYFNGTGNVFFDGNTVSNTAGDELFFTNNCINVRVTNNLFENCGQSISNTFCVRFYEGNYYIANNTFIDYGYGAIGVGVWHGFEKKNYSGGIIEHNELYFSPEYFANTWKYMLMDSGAIYTWTQNDNVIIRYNYIHDYTGAGDNRGIFCDDGANNLKIYGNVILNVPNSYCIDSPQAKDQKEGFKNNANNIIAQNVVDGRVRFQGYEGENRHAIKGANYVLSKDGNLPQESKFENLEWSEGDLAITPDNKFIKEQIRKCTHR